MIMAPTSILLPIIVKNRLSYIKHYCPTAKQIQNITQEEFMTLKNNQDSSQYDDIKGAADLGIQQFSTTPIDTTNSFYDVEGNIFAHKSDWEEEYFICTHEGDCEKESIVSDASSTNSGCRRRSYRSRPRKKKQKKKNRPKEKRVKQLDLSQDENKEKLPNTP